jgi:predicted SnoaL-like aldol condensation-catalyzing enzyme
VPDYIQHNPIIPTTAKALGEFFNSVAGTRKNLRVVVHHVIASGDWAWAHVNFFNLYNDDPNDRGVAGVDIFRFNSNGKIIEHWDVLQEVPDPAKAANPNGMFDDSKPRQTLISPDSKSFCFMMYFYIFKNRVAFLYLTRSPA